MISLSVLVLTRNDCITIDKCINSIVNQLIQNDELIVLDNNSIDDTVDIIHNLDCSERIKLVKSAINLGVSKGRNKLVEMSQNNYLVFIDSDMIIKEGAFTALRSDFMLYDSIYGVYNNTGSFWAEYKGIRYRLFSGKYDYTGSSRVLGNDEFISISGGIFAIKKSVFQKLNGFDVRYEYMEDMYFTVGLLSYKVSRFIDMRFKGAHMKSNYTLKSYIINSYKNGKYSAMFFRDIKTRNICISPSHYSPNQRCIALSTILNLMLCFICPWAALVFFPIQFYLTVYYLCNINIINQIMHREGKKPLYLVVFSFLLYAQEIITSFSYIIHTLSIIGKRNKL